MFETKPKTVAELRIMMESWCSAKFYDQYAKPLSS